MTEIPIHGEVARGFEGVRLAFAEAVRSSPLGGCALSVIVEGQSVVDLWGGHSKAGLPWSQNSSTVIFSATKGVVSILIGELVREGKLDLDEPVSLRWPEFAAAGKERITIRQALSHQAGLPFVRRDLSRDDVVDWDLITGELACEAPVFEPGQAYAYHALTFGWLAGEIIRRVTGKSVGAFLQERISKPLGVDAWIGIPADELSRVADLRSDIGPFIAGDDEISRSIMRVMTLGGAFPPALAVPGEGFSDPIIQQAEIPGVGGIATAASLARIWSSTVCPTDGVRLLSHGVIADMTREQSTGVPFWPIPGPYPRWGSGFMLNSEAREFLTPLSFGHDGAGGQVAFADEKNQVGFAFLTNDLQNPPADQRTVPILEELRLALGLPPVIDERHDKTF